MHNELIQAVHVFGSKHPEYRNGCIDVLHQVRVVDRIIVLPKPLLNPVGENMGSREMVHHMLSLHDWHFIETLHDQLDHRLQQGRTRWCGEYPLAKIRVVFGTQDQQHIVLQNFMNVIFVDEIRVGIDASVHVNDAVPPDVRLHDRKVAFIVGFHDLVVEMIVYETIHRFVVEKTILEPF
jgi:hypothetical protein